MVNWGMYEEILVLYFWHSANLLHENSFRESRLFSVFFCSSWHSINLRTSLCSLYITFPSFLHSTTFYKKRSISRHSNRACFLQVDIEESELEFRYLCHNMTWDCLLIPVLILRTISGSQYIPNMAYFGFETIASFHRFLYLTLKVF